MCKFNQYQFVKPLKTLLLFMMSILCFTTCKHKEINAQNSAFLEINISPEVKTSKANKWVFILAGQSNMAGRGLIEMQDTIPLDRVYTIDQNNNIIRAKEPLHFYEKSVEGLDCGLSFGTTLIHQLPDSISIILIPTAVGGSSISQWLGDSIQRNIKLLSNFNEKVELGKNLGTIKAILWHQGESDAVQPNLNFYNQRLAELFIKFRKITSTDNLPILIGKLGSYSTNENWQSINEQIESYALKDNHSIIIETNDLKDNGDKIHFNAASQRILGQRFANAYLKAIGYP